MARSRRPRVIARSDPRPLRGASPRAFAPPARRIAPIRRRRRRGLATRRGPREAATTPAWRHRSRVPPAHGSPDPRTVRRRADQTAVATCSRACGSPARTASRPAACAATTRGREPRAPPTQGRCHPRSSRSRRRSTSLARVGSPAPRAACARGCSGSLPHARQRRATPLDRAREAPESRCGRRGSGQRLRPVLFERALSAGVDRDGS